MAPVPDVATILQRVLLLERKQGFRNRAASGGLTRFAEQQIERAEPVRQAQLKRILVPLRDYGLADPDARAVAVEAALGELADDSGGIQPPGEVDKPAPATVERPPLRTSHLPEELDEPVTTLKGMRKPVVEALGHVGVRTIADLLYYFPRQHYDYTDTSSISRMRMGQKTTLVGTVENVRVNRTARNIAITTATISDQSGRVAVRWFNQPYILRTLPVGALVAITGEPEIFHGFVTFQPRDWELIQRDELTHAARLVPVYPLTKGLHQRSLRRTLHGVVEEYAGALLDYLPAGIARDIHLPPLWEAVREYHFPRDEPHLARAEQRLAFDELLLIQLGLLRRKALWQEHLPEVVVRVDAQLDAEFRASLPFTLTSAQARALDEILADLARPTPMSRLLQGDVGSGKTAVAAAALVQVVRNGRQGVVMAPTEILAEQHHRTVQRFLEPLGIRCELLVGSTPKVQRKQVYAAAADGSAQVVIGTHALIQEGLEFANLGLAITDEQHRFGVEQRGTLRSKGLHPHVLALTATPIPRSLAMTIYGDLDVSVIDELPAGRLPVATTWRRNPAEAYSVVRDEVRRGHQAFVVCPVIEESADSDMRSVLAEHKELSALVFSEFNVGLLHGKMKPAMKEATLTAFRNGEYHILVATSVVEVGIDVPNATVMVIRDAHRFGLAQLHQFRGRVGRGGDQAYCVLLSDAEGEAAAERLQALTASDSGFTLAEEDLRLRGPGEFWGTRQSGLPELRVARLGDIPTIHMAREAAQRILREDPDLVHQQHGLLRQRVQRFWSDSADLS